MEDKKEAKERAARLGELLRRQREAQGVGPARLAREAGISRSYLAYLEQGKFAEVGVDKFSRIVAALGLSADQALGEAGYMAKTEGTLPDPKTYLRERYGLPPAALEQALAFLDFLAARRRAAARRGK